MPQETAAFGIDHLCDNLPTGRVGLITNDAATTAHGARPSRVALREAGVNLVRLFSPEHGLTAAAADGQAIPDGHDPLTGLPVISLYGTTQAPPAATLADLDLLLYDIPDVGARFYTYIWTLSHAMQACAQAGKPLWVLDRPNPIGGDPTVSEGPVLDEAAVSSFVGRWDIPVRYGLTIGELAMLWNAERQIGTDLRIIRCTGWRRREHWPALGLPFVPPSPAMRNYETALLYPGTCLFEGTNLSEGRGTEAPFCQAGAPWVDGQAWSDAFNALELPGVRSWPVHFMGTGRKYPGQRCAGLRLHLTDPQALRPVAMGLWLIALLIRLHPQQFQWDPYRSAANPGGGGHFDRLIGRRDVRSQLEQLPHDGLPQRIREWTDAENWRERTAPFLLYQ